MTNPHHKAATELVSNVMAHVLEHLRGTLWWPVTWDDEEEDAAEHESGIGPYHDVDWIAERYGYADEGRRQQHREEARDGNWS